MNKLVSLLLSCLFINPITHAKADNWFADTPLQSSYSALSADQTLLAWQELQLSLSQNQINEHYWQPIKDAVLSKTQCGKQLISSVSLPANIDVSFINKNSVNNQGYQIKISTEQVTQPLILELFDENNTLLVTANIPLPTEEYIEFESNDLLSTPKAGIYQLSINNVRYPLVISSFTNTTWVRQSTDQTSKSFIVTPPENKIACAPAVMNWQWFDEQYNQIGKHISMQLTPVMPITSAATDNNLQYAAKRPAATPSNATWLSAVVSQFEYQGEVKVEYIQRFSLPISRIETYR
ncbi:DUF2861 domain-containing protein [Photobacterium profundum]|uniref:DUF2861 family protein n=1 Tax=Photobacterium profundum 3TCK TaxID=314280 RepID=Q1YW78_9GAMM|nr:DUF2861 family protein [Photobacterium profundum]EAS40556.1 hypothetical protein P3TCK_07032 [Photobacterium profundum 3TCK]PSV57885.1 DUF2861 domain-containing protein [Photobacterium profundum]